MEGIRQSLVVVILLFLILTEAAMNSQQQRTANNQIGSSLEAFYPIGTPGKPWTDEEKSLWKAGTKLHRSYREEVLDKLEILLAKAKGELQKEQYGALSHDPERYPLLAIRTTNWQANKPNILITGGVHGYETSGVQGAILFLATKAVEYSKDCNIVVAPCVSPWAYEHIQRWQADLKDPNRSFKENEQTEESKALMNYLNDLGVTQWDCHLDLHETTDTDATEFMPAKHAEAGLLYTSEVIPDGFYLVGDSENPQLEFQKAVIESVKRVTHIAPPDEEGNIIGEPVVSDGIIIVPAKTLGLCGGVTAGIYTSTTEVYPDSPKVTDDLCNAAQVAAVSGAIDFVLLQQQSCN